MIINKELREEVMKCVYMECDGFYVFEPQRPGYISEDMLLYAHLILKELNASWNEQINEYCEQQELEATSPQEEVTVP